jgi:ATP-dependent DNA helicase RecG
MSSVMAMVLFISRRYRNRRIGEFFKELDLTEGRCTGIPKMRAAMDKNGSPPPRFSTDEDRTYFLVELSDHPDLPGVGKAHDPTHDLNDTEKRIIEILLDGARPVPEIVHALGQKTLSDGIKHALQRLQQLGLISLTNPDRPRSKNQKRQFTAKGQAWLMYKTASDGEN